MTNKAIYDLDFNGRHIDTGKWPGNSLTLSPRVAAVWDIMGDKSLILRGGTGLFQGRLPLVFFTNMPTNSGMVQYQAQINAKNLDNLNKKYGTSYTMSEFAGPMITTVSGLKEKLFSMKNGDGVQLYPSTISPKDGAVPSAISAVDPDFKLPQVWKTSFAVDYRLPFEFPMSVTAEGIFNKTINDVCISDWSIPNVGGFARFNGVDNRPIYPGQSLIRLRSNQVTMPDPCKRVQVHRRLHCL